MPTDIDLEGIKAAIAKRGECAGPLTTWPSPGLAHVSIVCRDNWVETIEWLAVAEHKMPALVEEVERLRARQQELLAVIVRVTNETPFPDEIKGWTSQRAAMLAEIGTLRSEKTALVARVKELERDLAENNADYNEIRDDRDRLAAEPAEARAQLDEFYAATRGHTEGTPLDVFRQLLKVESERDEALGEISRMTMRPAAEVIEAERKRIARLDEMQAERDAAIARASSMAAVVEAAEELIDCSRGIAMDVAGYPIPFRLSKAIDHYRATKKEPSK